MLRSQNLQSVLACGVITAWLLSSGGAGALAQDSRFVRGDTNADGKIEITDAIEILGFLWEGQAAPDCMEADDTNDDGTLDIADAITILDFLFLGGTELPPPSSNQQTYGKDRCGSDPTPDGLGCKKFPICGLAPVASFVASLDPAVRLGVILDGSGSHSPETGRTIVSYGWDFGDGKTATIGEPLVKHTYSATGTYPVRLTVTDDQEISDDVSQQVAVTCSPPSPPVLDPLPQISCSSSLTVSGAAEAGSQVEVRSPKQVVSVAAVAGRFSAKVNLAQNQVNEVRSTATNTCGTSSASIGSVVQDSEPPVLTIDSPSDGSAISAGLVDVTGRVSDALSGLKGLQVMVNGFPATITGTDNQGGTYVAKGIPILAIGLTVISAVATDFCGTSAATSLVLNPTAPKSFEGYGSITQGAASSPDGFEVYHVTSLADTSATPGTLRNGLSQGKRHIVFDLGGIIVLTGDLEVRHSYITIDGKSAPAPGITISQVNQYQTAIEAYSSTGPVHDVVIHHLRSVGVGGVGSNKGDIWGLDGSEAAISKVVIDHITGLSSSDGIFDIYGDVKELTLSWNLIADTVVAINIYTPNTSLTRTGLSIHHNVFARNNERQVKIRYNSEMDYVNNVVYGWGWFEGLLGSLNIAYDSGAVNPSANIEDSVLLFVATPHGSPNEAIYSPRGAGQGQLYFKGNIVPPEETDAVSTGGRLAIPAYAEVTHYPAATLWSTVVPLVGTQYPTESEKLLLDTVQTAIKQ